MPTIKTKNDKLKEVRKQKIVECALKVFCEKGYHGTTINDIVKKAKCSHGLFYHYFENKKAIFDAVSESRGRSIMEFLDQGINTDFCFVDKLKHLTEYTFDNMKKDEIFAYRYYFFLSTVFHKAESGVLPPKNKVPPHVRMTAFFKDGMVVYDYAIRFSCEDIEILEEPIDKMIVILYQKSSLMSIPTTAAAKRPTGQSSENLPPTPSGI